MQKEKISVSLSTETLKKLDNLCQSEKRSRSNMIEVIIDCYNKPKTIKC